MTAIASVIIPAHDEARRIEETLRVLLDGTVDGELEVVVVCNGCRDDTARRARAVPGVVVHEISAAAKTLALTAGDRAATTFPRIYLDADTHLTAAAARAMVAALEPADVRVAGMRADLDLRGATRAARWYFEFRSLLPVFAEGIIGAGVYALDRRARERFEDWPSVIGDDQFVLRSFDRSERVLVSGHRTRSPVATDLRAILERGVRVRRGNRELSTVHRLPAPSAGVMTALRIGARDVRRWPAMVTWLGVTVLTRLLAATGLGRVDWEDTARPGRGS